MMQNHLGLWVPDDLVTTHTITPIQPQETEPTEPAMGKTAPGPGQVFAGVLFAAALIIIVMAAVSVF